MTSPRGLDARAYCWCNLGPLSEEGVSIAEDHAQGAGVIMLKGTINLKGIHRPVSGAVVKLAYSDGQTWIAQFPLRLRVLSCFSNPVTDRTSVSVGCDLAFYENRKEPIKLDTRDENTNVSDVQWRTQTPALSASWLVGMILCILRIEYIGTIPLTNYYTVQDFDMSAGYVEELGKLCVSEGYVCRMNENGKAEFLPKDQPIASSILLMQDDLLDINPINSGELPGDAVYAKYNSLKLKTPDPNQTEENRMTSNWESETSYGSIELYKHNWTNYTYTSDNTQQNTKQSKNPYGYPRFNPDGSSITELIVQDVKAIENTEIISFVPYSETTTSYDSKDRAVYRRTISQGVWGITRTETRFSYGDIVWAPLQSDSSSPSSSPTGSWTQFSCDYTSQPNTDTIQNRETAEIQDSTIDNNVSEEITIEWSPLGPIRQQLGMEGPFQTIKGVGQYQSLYREIKYSRGVNGSAKTTTRTLIPYIQTFDGSESLSRDRDKKRPWEITGSDITLATSLRDGGTEVRIRTERNFGTQKRPSAAERTSQSNQKAPNVEQQAQIVWAVGSAASQTAVELSPPYASDDRITDENGTLVVKTSDAAQKVTQYARLENRYLFGHRNGVGIQVLPEMLPPKPLSVVYIRMNGCTGAFLVNGRTWNIDPSGATVTCDALFWGAIDGTSVNDAWFPLPPGSTTLPAPVTIATNSNPIPANAIPIPTGFDFVNPDLNVLFGALPTNATPIPPALVAPEIIVKPYYETVYCFAGGGGGAIADPQFWIVQPAGEYLAGGGGGAFATITSSPPPNPGSLSNTTAITIPESGSATPYPSIINVTGYTGIIASVEITINGLSHTYLADVSILLVGPTGIKSLVMSSVGGNSSVSNLNLTFNDSAAAQLPESSAPQSGTYRPSVSYDPGNLPSPAPSSPYEYNFQSFVGTSPNGEWKLYVYDGSGPDSGSISGGWSINLSMAAAVWTSGSVFNAGSGGNISPQGPGATWTSSSVFNAGKGSGDADAQFSTVSVLLHGDGTNGSANIVDSSNNALSVGIYGEVLISTAQAKFGQSILFNPSYNSRLALPQSNLFLFEADFTVELWYYEIAFNSYSTLLEIGYFNTGIMVRHGSGSDDHGVWVNNTRLVASGTSYLGSFETWNYVKVVRSGSTVTASINGNTIGSTTTTATLGAFPDEPIYIGGSTHFPADRYFKGYIDELRISKFARTNTTPPTGPFSDV